MNSKAIAERLGETGLCVCPNFLSHWSLQRTAQDLDELRARGRFQSAGVGQARDRQAQVRRDETFWLDRNHKSSAAQIFLWRKIDLLKTAFNQSLYLGLTDFEGHYAAYPEGGYYQRHKDCLHGDSRRVVSFVLYLNRDWQSADGGRLRIYGAQESFQDIDPVGGTMVCFMSGESEHEVLLSHRPRFSLSGWFRRQRP